MKRFKQFLDEDYKISRSENDLDNIDIPFKKRKIKPKEPVDPEKIEHPDYSSLSNIIDLRNVLKAFPKGLPKNWDNLDFYKSNEKYRNALGIGMSDNEFKHHINFIKTQINNLKTAEQKFNKSKEDYKVKKDEWDKESEAADNLNTALDNAITAADVDENSNDIWFYGVSQIDPKSKLSNISCSDPLYLTKNPLHALIYSLQSKEGKKIDLNKSYLAAVRLKPDKCNFMDLTTPQDFSTAFQEIFYDKNGIDQLKTIFLDKNLSYIFANLDIYFSINSKAKNILRCNKHAIPYYNIARIFIQYKNSDESLSIPDCVTSENINLDKIDISDMDINDPNSFYSKYKDLKTEKGVEFFKNIDINNPEELQKQVSIINSFIDLLKIIREYIVDRHILTNIETEEARDKYNQICSRDDNEQMPLAQFFDIIQLVFIMIISEHFNGYYCPEYVFSSLKRYRKENETDLDIDLNMIKKSPVIAVFNESCIDNACIIDIHTATSIFNKLADQFYSEKNDKLYIPNIDKMLDLYSKNNNAAFKDILNLKKSNKDIDLDDFRKTDGPIFVLNTTKTSYKINGY